MSHLNAGTVCPNQNYYMYIGVLAHLSYCSYFDIQVIREDGIGKLLGCPRRC